MSYNDKFAFWKANVYDEEIRNELNKLEGDEVAKENCFFKDLSFGTAGIRGKLGAGPNCVNIYTVARAVKAYAVFLNRKKAQSVAISFDSRHNSQRFAQIASCILANSGIKVFLAHTMQPTPFLSFAIRTLRADGGIMFTASHNPKEYNGYKVYAEDGAQVGPEAADGITAFIRSTPYTDCKLMDEEEAKAKGLLKIIGNKEVDDDYIAQVKTLCIQPELLAEEGSKLSIVYTPIHGSGNVPVRRILREVGISNVSVVKEQELPDPNFSTVKVPNPEDPGAFVLAIKLADEVGAKVIFATDPDCDRLGVAVKTGNGDWQLLTGNQIGCVLLHYILSTKQKQGTLPKNGAAVKSIVSTSLANKIAASFGVEMFETLTGFKFIGEKIQQFQDTGSHTFLFGFEESYGFLSSTFVRDKDGVNASLLIAEVACACAAQGITLYDYVQSIFREYGYFVEKVVSKTLPGKDGLTRMKEIMKELRENPPKELCGMKVTAVRDYLKGTRTADGKVEPTGLPKSDVLYFELEKGNWVCVRPSGTEPKIKLYVNTNASDKADAEKLNADLRAASEALLD